MAETKFVSLSCSTNVEPKGSQRRRRKNDLVAVEFFCDDNNNDVDDDILHCDVSIKTFYVGYSSTTEALHWDVLKRRINCDVLPSTLGGTSASLFAETIQFSLSKI